MSELIDMAALFEKYGPVSKEHWGLLADLFETKSLKKGSFLCKSGQYAESEVVLLSGVLKNYYSGENGEFTKSLWLGPEICAPLHSRTWQGRSSWNIEALTACEVVVFNGQKFLELRMANRSWTRWAEGFMQVFFVQTSQEDYERWNLSAEERYRKLLNEKPELVNQISQNEIAKWLGINPVSLSRIRSRL